MAYNISKLARQSGISRQQIYAIKNTANPNVELKTLEKLAKVLNCGIGEVIVKLKEE